jgi:hypothetical protein
MTDKEKAAFLPFSAINDYMREDYRLEVVRAVLQSLPDLPKGEREGVERQISKNVKVPGFRNSSKAPYQVKVKPVADAFQKNSHLAAAILSAWSASQLELRSQVVDLLTSRGWEILPAEADRTKLPGFLTRWPKSEEFEILDRAFHAKYPDIPAKDDDISLMVVWISGRLPYEPVETDQIGVEISARNAPPPSEAEAGAGSSPEESQ